MTQQGVTVKKINPSILMVISLYSPKGSRDAQFLNNYAMINIRDALLRVPGIAQVDLYGGAEYGMRVWLRPDRLAALGLTPSDVIKAIKEQNLQAPAGQVGAAPSPPGQEFTYTVKAPGRLVTAEEFENIILRQTRRRRRAPDQGRGPGRAGQRELQLLRPGDREGLHRQVAGGSGGVAHGLPPAGRQPARIGGGDLPHAP